MNKMAVVIVIALAVIFGGFVMQGLGDPCYNTYLDGPLVVVAILGVMSILPYGIIELVRCNYNKKGTDSALAMPFICKALDLFITGMFFIAIATIVDLGKDLAFVLCKIHP